MNQQKQDLKNLPLYLLSDNVADSNKYKKRYKAQNILIVLFI